MPGDYPAIRYQGRGTSLVRRKQRLGKASLAYFGRTRFHLTPYYSILPHIAPYCPILRLIATLCSFNKTFFKIVVAL